MMLVDLPGYGFAKVSQAERESWGKLCETYLNTRKQIKAIIMIVDIRHEPTRDDKVMLQYIRESGKDYVIVANKADKLGKTEIKKQLDMIRKTLEPDEGTEIIPFSAVRKTGVETLWARIEEILKS